MSAAALDLPPPPEPLPHPVVDNHCHLEMALDGTEVWTPERVLDASAAVGVPRIVPPGNAGQVPQGISDLLTSPHPTETRVGRASQFYLIHLSARHEIQESQESHGQSP